MAFARPCYTDPGCYNASPGRYLDLQAEVDVGHGLMHRARAQNIDFCAHKMIHVFLPQRGGPPTSDGALAQIILRDASTRLEKELLPLPCPPLTQTPRDGSQLVAVDVVEHDDVGTGRDGLIRLVFISDFDIQEK